MINQKLSNISDKSVCVMQPYFFPYSGYYELFNVVKHFIIFDNAQMLKNGWIHRNRFLLEDQSTSDWLTLPLKKFHQTQKINEIELASNFNSILESRFLRFSSLRQKIELNQSLDEIIFSPKNDSLLMYLSKQLQFVNDFENRDVKFYMASELIKRNPQDHYQEYICKLVKELDCDTYYNLSGGKELYSTLYFAQNHINLKFLNSDAKNNLSHIYNLFDT